MHDVKPLPMMSIRNQLRQQVQELTGMEDVSGFEIVRMIHFLANFSNFVVCSGKQKYAISGQRWEILARLLAEEKRGNSEGINPTKISRFRNVSKNTISSLLRGLEGQGLILREMDPDDKRAFRIKLTDEGRRVALEITPIRLMHMNCLANGLTSSEKDQLIHLLAKLTKSIILQEKIIPKFLRGNYEEEN